MAQTGRVIRQGDVVLIPIDAPPEGVELREVALSGGRVVLATGEATGHAHALANGRGKLRSRSGEMEAVMYLEALLGGDSLVHEEHKPEIPLAPGYYEVRRQTIYTPIGKRQVED